MNIYIQPEKRKEDECKLVRRCDGRNVLKVTRSTIRIEAVDSDLVGLRQGCNFRPTICRVQGRLGNIVSQRTTLPADLRKELM